MFCLPLLLFFKRCTDQTAYVCILCFWQPLHFLCFIKKQLCSTLHWDSVSTFDISTWKLFNLEQVAWFLLLAFLLKCHLTLNKLLFPLWTSVCPLCEKGRASQSWSAWVWKIYGCDTVCICTHTSFYFACLYCHLQTLHFFFFLMNWRSVASLFKQVYPVFPVVFACFIFLCQIFLILTIFQTFSLLFYLL